MTVTDPDELGDDRIAADPDACSGQSSASNGRIQSTGWS
jgi:hypothetical protein